MKEIYAKNRQEWRNWLEKNHEKEHKVALIKYKKHTGKPSLTSMEAMEEAICFGWIDTTVKRLDEEKYMQKFSKRTKNSRWSKNTLGYAKRLIKEGKMTPVGLKFYKEGLKKPVLGHGIPDNPDTPENFLKELNKNKTAKENFERFSPSVKRIYNRWILSAKLDETKKKRIEKCVKAAEINKKMPMM